jgi:hypothetical protein
MNNSANQSVQITQTDLHPHLQARMLQRGVLFSEMERALNEGWEAPDAKPGTVGRVFVFTYQSEWEGRFYEEKEVTVYYKVVAGQVVLLTVKARYGKSFPRK